MPATAPRSPLPLAAALVLLLPPGPLAAQQVARSADGMVVTSHPLATEAGVAALEAGGNAVDAAVAAAFALGVVEPEMSGLGGRTQFLLRAADGTVAGIDGTTQVPAAYRWDPDGDHGDEGPGTIGVPGTVAALTRALEEHGTLPLERVMAPAIRYAEEGVALLPIQARFMADQAEALGRYPGAAAHFLKPDGTPYRAGERFRQPALARTLRAIARGGRDAFYSGEIARRMAADLEAMGGWVRYEDLAAYRAEESIVVRGRYRGRDLVGTYLPASGATTIEILQVLERSGAGDLDEAAWADRVARASVRAFADRVSPDGRTPEEKAAWITSDSLADRRAREVAAGEWIGAGATAGAPEDGGEPPYTSHLSVADRHGNVVAMTQSLGPAWGSNVATEGLGFPYASAMGYLGRYEPGERPWSSQSPLIVVRDGEPELVLGGAGSRRIISGIVQTISRTLARGERFPEALAAPRLHPDTAELTVEVRPEAAWDHEVVERLREIGWRVEPDDYAGYFARLHTIWRDRQTGEWVGVADPRGPGTAKAPRIR